MKKIKVYVPIILLTVVLIFPGHVLAMDKPNPTDRAARASQQEQEDLYPLSELGFNDTRLIGPYDSTGVQVSFPEEWAFNLAGSLHLEYSVSVSGYGDDEAENVIAGVLDFSVNNNFVASILLDQTGEQVVEIDFSANDLLTDPDDGRLEFDFDLISEESCTDDFEVTVTIRETSFLYLPHTQTSPPLDLTVFPRPLFQPNSFFDRRAVMVLPNNPTEFELQAAMDVSAGLGNLTNGDLILEVVTSSALSAQQLNSGNLIFVGNPGSFPRLSQLDLPIPLEAGSLVYEAAEAEDGFIQIVPSPWNENRVIYVISSNTDAGMVKAGQAIKFGEILTAGRNDVAIVQNYRKNVVPASVDVDRTFQELGYEDRTVSYIGTSFITIEFFIPPQQTVGDDAHFTFLYNYSSILDNNSSGITISLNGRNLGSIQFQEDTTEIKEAELNLPKSAFLKGLNELVIQVRLVPLDECAELDYFQSAWTTIFSESNLHIPFSNVMEPVAVDIDLARYPQNLVTGEALGELVFILSPDSPNSWSTASQLAYNIGNNAGGYLSQINVMFPDDIPQESLADANILIIGRPTNLPYIYELSDLLPAPFEAGSEVPFDPASRVIYRVVPGSVVGYIESFISPWNSERIAMLISGNTDVGLALAGAALADGEFTGNLSGNFAIVASGRILSLDTRFSLAAEALESPDIIGEEQPSEILPSSTATQGINREWMVPAIIAVSGATLVVAVIAFIRALRRPENKE